jgi:PAS domain S-box-containing protein
MRAQLYSTYRLGAFLGSETASVKAADLARTSQSMEAIRREALKNQDVASPKPLANRKIQLAFGTAILTLLVMSAISYRARVLSNESERWVEHTHEVLENLQDLELAMETVRSSYHEFALTGDESALGPLRTNQLIAMQRITAIRNLTVDNASQQRRIVDIERLTVQRIQFAQRVITLRRMKGSDAAADAVRSQQNQPTLDELSAALHEVQAEELRLLGLRDVDAAKRLRQTKTSLVALTILALFIVAAAGWNVQQEDSRFRGLMEAAPDAMVVINQTGEVVLLNGRAEKQFGYQRNELLNRPIEILIPQRFRSQLHAFLGQPQVRAMGQGLELFGLRKDGSEFPAEIMLSPLENAKGILITAAIRDISVRKAAEENLRQSEERLSWVVSNATDYAILMLDLEGRVVSWNEGAERIKGYRAEEIIGQHFSRFYPAEDLRNGVPALELAEATRNGRSENEGWRVRKDGSQFYANVVLTALRDKTGRLRGVGTITRDVTERIRAEEHQAKAAAELKRSNDQLEQFAYVASHDLQEPLRMVASYTQLLAKRYKGRLDSDAGEFIAYAVDGCNRMQSLIRDLLAYSRSGADTKVLHEVSGEAALNVALENVRVSMEDSGAIVTHDLLPDLTSDETQLVQVFQNLIGNAIKYHGAAAPLIHVSATKSGDKEWIFSVQDNGLGIAPQYFERIFIIFQRLHGKHEFDGTGIGLALCKKNVEQLGGRIWVESQLDKGSTFYFALPVNEGK